MLPIVLVVHCILKKYVYTYLIVALWKFIFMLRSSLNEFWTNLYIYLWAISGLRRKKKGFFFYPKSVSQVQKLKKQCFHGIQVSSFAYYLYRKLKYIASDIVFYLIAIMKQGMCIIFLVTKWSCHQQLFYMHWFSNCLYGVRKWHYPVPEHKRIFYLLFLCIILVF